MKELAREILLKHFGTIILAVAIVIAAFLYAQCNRFTHVSQALVMDHWTGAVAISTPKPQPRFDPSQPYDIENADGTRTHVDPRKQSQNPQSKLPDGFVLDK